MSASPRTVLRSSVLAATFALVAGILPVVAAEPAAAAPVATAMVATQRMSQPTLNSTQVGWYPKGARLTLSCYAYGQSVRGYFSPWVPNGGWSSLWYRTSDGFWAADIDLSTGSNNPVTGPCSTPQTPSSPSLSAKVDAFVTKHSGRYVDYDGRYGYQCVDLFNFFNRDVVGAGFIGVNYAWQLYSAAPTSKYEKLPASAAPRKGDVAIWASSLPNSGGGGHVAIVLSAPSSSTISVFEQRVRLSNGTYSASIVRTETKAHLIGYLRPKV